MKRRERTEVIFDILSTVQAKGGKIKPTHLLYKANLSHDALKRYVAELIQSEMLEEITAGERAYKLTDKGYHFLSKYQQFKEFNDAFGI